MSKEEIDRLVSIRNNLIAFYKQGLNGKHEPSAIIKQSDVALLLSENIGLIDNLLSSHVKFS